MSKLLPHTAVAALFFSSLTCLAWADETVEVEINKGHMVKLSRPAASVVVADPTTADVQVVSPKLVFVHGKKIGETSITAVDANDDPIFEGTIDVTHNLSSLAREAKKVAPDSDVTFKTVDGGLVISGTADNIQDSENIRSLAGAYVGKTDTVVNMVNSSGGDQVMLQVKIVEMARTDLKNLGINLQSVLNHGATGFQLLQGSDINMVGGVVARGGSTDTNIVGSFSKGGTSITGLIDALESQGLATVLAEPSLTTTSGKAASFLAGGQYPIPLKGDNGTVSVSYQQFGVSLNFTPVVMSKNRMSILVAPEVSTLDFANPIQVAGFTYPILDTRKAQATVELGSGQTFALAGLLKNESSNKIDKLPGVGDVPVLGALFSSSRFQNDQTELVILVTPFIVHPISDPKKVQTPLSGFEKPSDAQRLMFNDLYKQEDIKEDKANDKTEDKNPMAEDNATTAPDAPAAPVDVKPLAPVAPPAKKEQIILPDRTETIAPDPEPEEHTTNTAPEPAKSHGKSGFILE